MMMNRKNCVLTVSICLMLLLKHAFASQNGCASYTITNVYGTDGPISNDLSPQNTETIIRGETGRPGKVGPAGAPGPQGVGIKGEPGDQGPPGKDCSVAELQNLRNQVEAMNQFVDIPRTCEDVRSNQSGTYLISPKPDVVQPFYVFCNFSSDQAISQVRHNSLAETQVSACESQFCYKRDVTYNANLDQVVALIEVSSTCKQYIKYRCDGSVLLYNGDQYGAWVSRDGDVMRYWGGTTSLQDYYCACGDTGTCDLPNTKCNCDKNVSPETSDEGYLTEKLKLPVKRLMFGDSADPGEYGWHTLGPLECMGKA